MANQGYQIGQLRYSGSGCISKVNCTIDYEAVPMGDGGAATSFQDLAIKPNSSLIAGQPYYLSLDIPQDMNYDLNFNIKLVKSDSNDYQFLRNVSIVRGGSGDNTQNVVLYELDDGTIRAMIPFPYKPGTQNTKGYIYYDENNGNYYLGNGGTKYTRTSKYNDITMIASWKQSTTNNFGSFELVFKPVEDGFSKIVISMVRDATDYNIQRLDNNGNIEFGRKVDKNLVRFGLSKIYNFVDNINKGGSLSRIGVWSRPGLMMCINGEEIKVGTNGYYELDALPVTSIGFIAKDNDYSNNWTLDYEYIASSN